MADDAKGASDFTRDMGPLHEGPRQASPYPLSRLAPVHDLVDVAKQIQEADAMLGAVTGNKLLLLAKQIRALQDEARRLLEAAERDARLHRARCHLKKRPGATYHFYRDPTGALYVSMLSPDDWRGNPPHAFEGSYRLEPDMSWTDAGEVERVDAERARLPPLLGSGV